MEIDSMRRPAGSSRYPGKAGAGPAVLAAALVSLAWPQPASADTQTGLADFARGAFAEAYQEWRGAADAGDARAALFIGVLYDSGEGVTRDVGQALTWYRRAADGGSVAGAFNVAVLYDGGRGAPRDPARALAWYRRAADAGYGRADYNLGLIYESGDGVPRDHQLATEFFRRAARQGISAARTHLAGLGEPAGRSSPSEADPATRDFAMAQGILLNRGPSEVAKAAELFSRAAGQSNALGEYDLAYCYQNGLGVPRNLSRADELYRRAASHAKDAFLRSLALAAEEKLRDELAQTVGGVTR